MDIPAPAPTPTRPNRLWTIAVVATMAVAGVLFLMDRRTPRLQAPPAPAPVEAADLKTGSDRPPRLLKGAPPLLPANHLAISPTIICRILVGLDGNVLEAKVYQSRPELAEYERAALVAVRQYEFIPAAKGGNTVKAWINWPISFTDPSQIVETVRLKGSDTIGGELAPRLGVAFRDERPDLNVSVDAFGTATAFSGLYDQSADIGLASRSANKDELARASYLHIKLAEYVFAYDGIAVIVNPNNSLNELSLEQVSKIFSGKIKTWREAGAQKGGTIRLLSRPPYSGTHEFFRQRVVRLNNNDSTDNFATDTEWVERNEDLLAKVAENPDAIGYVGLGWVHKSVKALNLVSNGKSVRPSEETVQDATYPVSRPLLMYTRGAPSPNAAAFLRFVFSPPGQEVIKAAGFVPTEATFLVVVPRDKPEVPAYELFRVEFQDKALNFDANEEAKINRAVEPLKTLKTKVLVVGNSDSNEGTAADGLKISDQRALAVSEYLKKQGVAANRILVQSDGLTHPLAAKGTPVHGVNRRVDLYLVHEGG